MKVSELMTRDPEVVDPECSLADAIDRMVERTIRHLPVVELGRLIGVVSERDLLEATGWNPDRYFEADRTPKVVRDYMSVPVETVSVDDDVGAAVAVFLARRIGCLPVVAADGKYEGVLTVTDLVAEHVRACLAARAIGELDAVVAACMSEAPVTVDPWTTVGDARSICHAHDVRHLPVQSEGWFVGLVSDRDLLLRIGHGDLGCKVEAIMSTGLATIGPEHLLSDAARIMQSRRVESIPVTRDGRLLGMLTSTDVLRVLQEKLASTSEA